MRFNVDQIRRDIESLLREYPDLADDEELRLDMLEGITDMREALDILVAQAQETGTLCEALRDRMADLRSRRERLEHRIDVLRGVMLKIMQSADLKKIELAEATLTQRGQAPQVVGNITPDELPDNLCRIKREPNVTKIREALLRGDLVPGMYLSNSPPTLMIRTK